MPTRGAAQVVRGFLMGSADVVPGVSGGTVALVLGIYRPLIEAIRTGARALGHLARLDVRGAIRLLRSVDWGFLLPLLVGIALAILTLARAIETLLERHPVRMAGVFLGLIAGSIYVAWGLLQRRDPLRLLTLGTVAIVTFVVLGLRAGPVAAPSLALVFAAGAIAVCAMILPGVSGAFLLLMVGMYDTMLAAVNERDPAMIAAFVIGAVIGLASFSSMLGWLLVRHEQTVMAVLIGLMVGSLRVLWPWPEGTDGTGLAAPAGDVLAPGVLAVVCATAVVAVSLAGRAHAHEDRGSRP